MRAIARIFWFLAILVLGVGAGSWLHRHWPVTLASLRSAGERYLDGALTSPVLASAGLALALALCAAVMDTVRSSRSSRRGLHERPAVSPLAVVNEDVALAVREMLVELGQTLRGLAARAEPDVVAFTETLVQGAIRIGASDVHIHPLEVGTRIALRIHGVLEEVLTFPRQHYPRLLNRLKILAKLPIFGIERPQDGHFAVSTPEGPADIRISVLPTNHGEAVALRIGRTGIELPRLAALGFPQSLLDQYQQLLALPQGLVFVAGATGSGKTTTLYASLGHIKQSRGEMTRIATIEDPVEYDVPLFSQTQVNADQGLTFAQGLRSVLRQDPNVIMVGEIRDPETARTAVQAGLSGHLLLTTVHANSAAGVFTRLVEIGVEPFLLASASVASISQRLVRALCPYCREPAPLSPQDAARLDMARLATGPFFTGAGCQRCDGTGYLGRTAIYEMLVVSPTIRDCINARVPTPKIQEAAVAQGMIPLLTAGVERARAGVTTLQEVFRVVG